MEIHAHLWQQNGEWLCGIIDTCKTANPKPTVKYAYTAYSSLDPNMLIHCYWLSDLPPDEVRDSLRELIFAQAYGYYQAVHGGED